MSINDANNDNKAGIFVGYDWQIFIPSRNKTVLISDIISEMKTGKQGHGIFSMDHAPGCINHVFSAKVDNQIINFPISDTDRHYIFIKN